MEESSTLEFELAAGLDLNSCNASVSCTKLSSTDSPSLGSSSLRWYSASDSSVLFLGLFLGEMTVLAAYNVDNAGILSAWSLEFFPYDTFEAQLVHRMYRRWF